VYALKELDDPRLVNEFAQCLQDRDRNVRSDAAYALKRLLPKLQAGDAESLSPESMDALIRVLGGRDRDLSIAILKALEQVGDERALPAVERLASRKGRGRDGHVYRAAEECLPALRQRAERSRQAHTLLRAADSVDDATVLLRPARAGVSTVERLVRPADGIR
jgi:HEAT repeat protein